MCPQDSILDGEIRYILARQVISALCLSPNGIRFDHYYCMFVTNLLPHVPTRFGTTLTIVTL